MHIPSCNVVAVPTGPFLTVHASVEQPGSVKRPAALVIQTLHLDTREHVASAVPSAV